MSISSQQHHMQRLCVLLARDLSGLHGPRESGPNGAKDAFLHVGKTFLRALAKDLGLREVKVLSNPGGIGVISTDLWPFLRSSHNASTS